MRLALTLALIALLPSLAGAYNVRTDRPRILIGDGRGPGTSLATFQQRCTSDPAYMKRCNNAFSSGTSAMNRAAYYLVSGDATHCTEAFTAVQSAASATAGQPDPHSFVSSNAGVMLDLAVVRDWCDPVLDGTQKQWLETKMTDWADWLSTTGGLDVYHDDMNNVWHAVALAGLALTGTAVDAKAQGYLAMADTQFKNVIFPAVAYEGDWWHEGFTYVQPSVGGLALYAAAWSIATDEDIFAWAEQNAGDVFNGYLMMHAYALRPDYRYVYFGDTSDNKQSIELFSRWLVDLLTLGTHSPVGKGLAAEIEANSRPGYDYSGANGYLLALYDDASTQPAPRSSLPTARWLSQGAADIAVLRSGWGADDTYLWMSCGDYFGAHGHDEVGGFQLFRHALLSGASGYYDNFDTDHWQSWYSQHSVHASTLAIYQPGEFFPTTASLASKSANVNDGGQRVLRRDQNGTAYGNPDLPTYLAHKTSGTHLETGTLATFEHGMLHDYLACDITAAYDSTVIATNGNSAKVSEVTRQLVFLRPELVVIFDRVAATDPSYEKRFLLQAAASPTVNGNDFTITNGAGRLLGRTLLPAQATLRVVDNFTVDGTSHPPNPPGIESEGTRIEVVPQQAGARDYFLHVLDATDPSKSALPSTTLSEDATSATVTIDDGTSTWTVTFDKMGAPGGHLTVTSDGGGTVYDNPLGAGSTSMGDGGVPTSDGAATVRDGGSITRDGASGAGDGGAGASADQGCGCRLGGRPVGMPWLASPVLAAIAISRRRRRR